MPWSLAFVRRVPNLDRESYINECCVGGDAVLDALLPALRAHYGEVDSGQEDWGWFAWSRAGDVRLAIDIHTDDADAGEFRIHLTSRTKRRLWGEKVADTPELDALRALVERALAAWGADRMQVTRLDEDYREIDG